MDSRLEQLEQELKNYRESMESMTSTLIGQFSEWANSHVEIIAPILHETDHGRDLPHVTVVH